MEPRKPDPQQPPAPEEEEAGQCEPQPRSHIAQHELLKKDLPKKDVADALDLFDGDEN